MFHNNISLVHIRHFGFLMPQKNFRISCVWKKKNWVKKSSKRFIFFGQYQTKVATVHLARNMWLLSLKWQWSSIPLGQIGTLAGKKWVERKKRVKNIMLLITYTRISKIAKYGILFLREWILNIAPFPCELKKKFTYLI